MKDYSVLLDNLKIELLEDWVNRPEDHYCRGGKENYPMCMFCLNLFFDNLHKSSEES